MFIGFFLHSNKYNLNNDKKEISLKEKLDEFIYNIKYIPKDDIKYAIIEQYLQNSNYIKNSPKIKLNEFFEVEEKKKPKIKIHQESIIITNYYGME